MQKKTVKKILAQKKLAKTDFIFASFSDGRSLNVCLNPNDQVGRARVLAQFQTKQGTITSDDGQLFDLRKLVHYELKN